MDISNFKEYMGKFLKGCGCLTIGSIVLLIIVGIFVDDEEKKGNEVKNLEIIYPDDGVILIPSTVMIVAEEYSKNVNIEAAEAVADWFLTDEAQEIVQKAYMHSPLVSMKEPPAHSIPTQDLIEKDMGVDWVKAYQQREEINNLWTEKVTQ